jgi:GTP-binding protein Era
LEKFFGKSIFLEVFVKVDKDWRQSDRAMKSYGYNLE